MAWYFVMPSDAKPPRPVPAGVIPIERAFDELRFGAARTLNLRDGLPTVPQAERRIEAWLRQRQAEGGGDVLVITGRGLGSLDGVGKVREAVLRRCTQLKRLNVVVAVREHGPGALVVTVAPLRALVDAPRLRTGRKSPAPLVEPGELAALPGDIVARLRHLAELTIQRLGVREPSEMMVAGEMRAQFAALAAGVAGADDPEEAFRRVADRLLQELHDE
jgi:hypothetical protein